MRARPRVGLAIAAAILAAPSCPVSATAEEVVELAVVVNAGNSSAVSAVDLENIFLLKRRQWPDGTQVIAFNGPPGEAKRRAFDSAALRLSPDEAARYWLDLRIRNGTQPPRQIGDAAVALRLAAHLKGVITYVPASMVNSSVRVVARIRRGKVLPP